MSNGTMLPVYYPHLLNESKDPERDDTPENNMSIMYIVFIIEIICLMIIILNGGEQYDRLKWSLSRLISRIIGKCSAMPLPPYLRSMLYHWFSNYMGIKLNELPAGTDLNHFTSFNEFFTRQIDLSIRPIADANDSTTLCSPCDGTIVSTGSVNTAKCTIDCVKGYDYMLEEFLFGHVETDEESRQK